MQTDFVVLARSARPNPDGTVDAEGLGVSDVIVSGVPAALHLVLVLKLRLAPSEQITRHRLTVALAASHGRVGQVPLAALDISRSTPGTVRPDGQPSLLVFELNPRVVVAGQYQLVVQEDGLPIGAVPFRVVQQ